MFFKIGYLIIMGISGQNEDATIIRGTYIGVDDMVIGYRKKWMVEVEKYEFLIVQWPIRLRSSNTITLVTEVLTTSTSGSSIMFPY